MSAGMTTRTVKRFPALVVRSPCTKVLPVGSYHCIVGNMRRRSARSTPRRCCCSGVQAIGVFRLAWERPCRSVLITRTKNVAARVSDKIVSLNFADLARCANDC